MFRETFRHFDFWLLGAVAVLTVFGIAVIWSAMAGNEVLLEVFPRQIIFSVLGFAVVIAVASVDYHLFNPASRVLYWLVFLLLVMVLVAGVVSGGAARWLDTGFFFIQPSELAKIVIILILADYFSRTEGRTHDINWIVRSLVPTLGLLVLIFIQPDLDTSIVIMVIWFMQLWASGLPMRYVILFGILGVALSVIAFPFLADYQRERIVTFFFPNSDARFGNEYNINQAIISIGSGGLLGQGYGQASQVQLRFLKVRHTDFIFSALSAEFGFVGSVAVLALLIFVVYRCLRAARVARDTYGALICYG
ncbi:MAG TPA: FtsW/RodA/SpoVE family cell cycle protein, partial [Anaerolineales bacterium]|nr:FtsW/RodA/SpoVE family cell cycle protein [Anaerolineales bacterium]